MEESFSFRRKMLNRSKMNEAKAERMQQKLDAGFVSKDFPEVTSIIISIIHNQRGARSLLRTLNFYPNSYAFFRINCLSNDCIDGGFDLTQVINTMVRNHTETAKGELNCENNESPANHAAIVYNVAIQYA